MKLKKKKRGLSPDIKSAKMIDVDMSSSSSSVTAPPLKHEHYHHNHHHHQQQQQNLPWYHEKY